MPSDPLYLSILSLMRTMGGDADLFRAAMEYIGTLTPIQTIVNRPEVNERILAAQQRMKDVPPMAMPGPSRTQLLELAG